MRHSLEVRSQGGKHKEETCKEEEHEYMPIKEKVHKEKAHTEDENERNKGT